MSKEPTIEEYIKPEHFHVLTRSLIGLPVSRTWRGYGTAIFFELGELSPRNYSRRDGTVHTSYWGQATIDLEIGWRVERPRAIFFGSSSDDRRISNGLERLEGLEVVDIIVQGRLPELVVRLSHGFWLQSFSTWEGQPEWTLFFNENASFNCKWLMSKHGKIALATTQAEA